VKRQKKPWSCGAAVVRNALRVFGIRVSEHDIWPVANTSKSYGTSEKGIITALRYWGCTVVDHHFDDKTEAWDWLHETLQEGRVVILAAENWEHWVLAIGSLGPNGVVVFDSSNFKNNVYENCTHILNKKKLMHKWYNDRKSISEDESRIYAISVIK